MKNWFLIILFIAFSCNTDKETKVDKAVVQLQDVNKDSNIELKVYDYNDIKPLLNKQGDKVYIVNFWATWCAPCVKELPYFEQIGEELENEVEVLLVSLDFPSKYESKLKPFIKKYELKSEVIALNDTDQDTWISGINKDWSGALPATIIYNGEERQFYEQSFTYEELEKAVKQFIK